MLNKRQICRLFHFAALFSHPKDFMLALALIMEALLARPDRHFKPVFITDTTRGRFSKAPLFIFDLIVRVRGNLI